jgi:hypothetical protein
MVRAGISRLDDVEDHEQSSEDATQKPYSPSPDAGSRKRMVPETCSPDRRCTSAVGMKRNEGGAAVNRGESENWDDLDAGCQTPFIGRSPRTDSYLRSVRILNLTAKQPKN